MFFFLHADPRLVVVTPEVMPIESGKPVVLRCSGNFSGNVIYQFTNLWNGQSLQSGSSDVFKLSSADVTDSGVYRCYVTLDSGAKFSSGDVTVKVVGKLCSYYFRLSREIYQRCCHGYNSW